MRFRRGFNRAGCSKQRLLVSVIFVASGCAHASEQRDSGPGAETVSSGGACRVIEPAILGSNLPAARSLGLAINDTTTSVVLGDQDRLYVLAHRVAEGARPVANEFSGANDLFAYEALGEDFVAIVTQPCPSDIDAARCLFAQRIASDGHARGGGTALALPSPLRSAKVTSTEGALFVARSHREGPALLDRISFEGEEVAVRSLVLGRDFGTEETPIEILGLAANSGSWAVVYRRGSSEDPRSATLLATSIDEHEVSALHEALVLDSFQWYGGALSMIASFEFEGPTLIRLGANGELRGEPRPVAATDGVPAPFARKRSALVQWNSGSAWIAVRDARGASVGSMELPAGTRLADVARRGDALEVAWLEERNGERTLHMGEIRCENRRWTTPAAVPQ